jgi:hypothetical protein
MGRTLPLLHSVLVIKAKEWAFRSCIENGNDEYLSLNAIANRRALSPGFSASSKAVTAASVRHKQPLREHESFYHSELLEKVESNYLSLKFADMLEIWFSLLRP